MDIYAYSGERYNCLTGLQYLRARWYDTENGRFISEDSYLGVRREPLTRNRYIYTCNNPVNYVDPSGHMRNYSVLMADTGGGSLKGSTAVSKAASVGSTIGKKVKDTLLEKQNSSSENKVSNELPRPVAGVVKQMDEIWNNAIERAMEEAVANQDKEECGIVYAKATGYLTVAEQEENAIYIYNYLSDRGWTKEAICGLLGNIQEECTMNPGAWQDDNNVSMGYGIVQWTRADEKILEWMGFKNAASANAYAINYPKEMLTAQLELIILTSDPDLGYESMEWYGTMGKERYDAPYDMTFKEYISSTCDVGEMALVFHGAYERSGDSPERRERRVKYAEEWYCYFSNQ